MLVAIGKTLLPGSLWNVFFCSIKLRGFESTILHKVSRSHRIKKVQKFEAEKCASEKVL